MNSTDAFVINSDEENNKDDYDEPTAESHDDSNSGSYNTSNHSQSESNLDNQTEETNVYTVYPIKKYRDWTKEKIENGCHSKTINKYY